MTYEMVNIFVDILDPGKDRRAIKVSDGVRIFWLPKSQIRRIIYLGGQAHRLIIPRWLAEQKGLE